MLPEQFASMVADAKARIDARNAAAKRVLADIRAQQEEDAHALREAIYHSDGSEDDEDRRSEWRGAL